MKQADFDALVRRLEQVAASNPRAYHLKLGAFAALGYLYVLGMLLVLAALTAGLIASLLFTKGLALLVKKLVIPVVVLIGLILRSLWVRIGAPTGLALEPQRLPQLFGAIDEVRRVTRAPRVHAVLLTNEMNAAVVQVPRLGLLGWPRNYLILGLPLMQMMSPDEFRAVLAHEFGHLSGAHGRFGAWIYRVRALWERLASALQAEKHWGSFMFVPFFSWYAPKFAAWSFVKARQQEYEADRLAAETVGAGSIANALVRLELKGEELSRRFWPGIFEKADTEPKPTDRPFRSLGHPDRRQLLPDAGQRLEEALGRGTSTADTHPCLRERIAALATVAAVPRPVVRSAAEDLLSGELDVLTERLDDSWQEDVSGWWGARHSFMANARMRLEQLERPGLDDAELEERAGLTELVRGAASAFPLYEELLRRSPGHTGALLACGRLLLGRGDETGIALIDEAMLRSPDTVTAGCDAIVGFLRERGRETEAAGYVDRYWKRQEEVQHITEERQTLRTTDSYFAHSMPPDLLEALVSRLAASAGVQRAYLVEKACKLSSAPLYVVGFEPSIPWHRLAAADHGSDLAQQIARDFDHPIEVFFVPLNRNNRGFRKIFRGIKGSRIHPR